jgi:hypothetical protein
VDPCTNYNVLLVFVDRDQVVLSEIFGLNCDRRSLLAQFINVACNRNNWDAHARQTVAEVVFSHKLLICGALKLYPKLFLYFTECVWKAIGEVYCVVFALEFVAERKFIVFFTTLLSIECII